MHDLHQGNDGQGAPDDAPVVAIMQPYLFPYLGYFHLIEASDIFVFYDDVGFIKQGWINRNRILMNGKPHTFSLPLVGVSSNRTIEDHKTADVRMFREKFLKQLQQAYAQAPQREQGLQYVANVLDVDSECSAAEMARRSVRAVYDLLGRDIVDRVASRDFQATRPLERVERIAAITKELGSHRYVNARGGRALYNADDFTPFGITLQFVDSHLAPYRQVGTTAFCPGLSIIDLLMHLDTQAVTEQLAGWRRVD